MTSASATKPANTWWSPPRQSLSRVRAVRIIWSSGSRQSNSAPSRWRSSFSRLGRDQAGAAFEGEVGPQPLHGDQDPVAEADQEVDVRQAPDEPGQNAGQAQR